MSTSACFVSTRGVSNASFLEMIFTGFCADGGILLPKNLHVFSKQDIWNMRSMTFSEICFQVLAQYCPKEELDHKTLHEIVVGSHGSFGHADVISVVPLKAGVSVAELFHGPTHAFKDLAMQVVGRLVNYALTLQSRRAYCVISTTGDTGPAGETDEARFVLDFTFVFDQRLRL